MLNHFGLHANLQRSCTVCALQVVDHLQNAQRLEYKTSTLVLTPRILSDIIDLNDKNIQLKRSELLKKGTKSLIF
jgi:hypothetical protein